MAYVYQNVIVRQIKVAKLAKFRHVKVAFFVIMVLVGVPIMQYVNVIKRMEKQNITVKVVICLLHAMEIHVRMVENVPATFKRMILRSVS